MKIINFLLIHLVNGSYFIFNTFNVKASYVSMIPTDG